MPSLLSTAITQPPRNQHLLLLQSTTAQSCLPTLRSIASKASERAHETTVLFNLLYPPSALLDTSREASDNVVVVNRTSHVPGYCDEIQSEGDAVASLKSAILSPARAAPAGPVNIIIDSVDTLLSDIGLISETTRLLSELLAIVRARGGTSRLILHILAPSPLLPILTQTRFSPTLTHVLAHPTALLTHLAAAYLTPPPPLAPPDKFWGVFIPISERHYEAEKLVFGPAGEGSGLQDFAVEVLVRGGGGGADGVAGRRRGVERVLEGWSTSTGGPCELREIESLRPLWSKKAPLESAPDPTQNLSFNLNLTPEQQRSRAQVPLPYAHEGKPVEQVNAPAAILYDPDSADDLDDDDPDEDLDI